MFKRAIVVCLLALAATGTPQAARTLDLYFIDVEGGQATLIVTPAGESLLVDTGFASDGTFTSKPGDPARARDAQRILATTRAAGVRALDYVLITHFHADHDGGVVELSKLIPIKAFIDHESVPPEAESVKGTLDAFAAYAAVRAKGKHLTPAPGARLPLKDVDATVVSAGGKVLSAPLPEASGQPAECATPLPAKQEVIENTRSTGFRLRYGRFRFLDLGDLVDEPLRALACPNNLVGAVDLYLVAHHGHDDAADAATLAAFRPRVAVLNNGPTKGGGAALLNALSALGGVETWQLHRSAAAGAKNVDDDRIANLDETTAHWIKVSASEDGSFVVTNARTGGTKRYGQR